MQEIFLINQEESTEIITRQNWVKSKRRKTHLMGSWSMRSDNWNNGPFEDDEEELVEGEFNEEVASSSSSIKSDDVKLIESSSFVNSFSVTIFKQFFSSSDVGNIICAFFYQQNKINLFKVTLACFIPLYIVWHNINKYIIWL